MARYEQNLEKAKTEKRSSVWIDKTVVALNDINPSAYPLEKTEARGSADPSVIPQAQGVEQPKPEPEEEATEEGGDQ